ncbi:hypothetical protein ACFODO_20800 [Acinetobacter sichuanensis]|uniref:Uncharacterized protein n=1 Tax=Acinetobacter sichuanensis TaxID=2136183 RepID=A0A371YIP9_9GAMM|nr:hypothetical protein [Acinetobacter sichuanensis]RFC81345.1 hypothetical protein C9E89_022370 [Acinetobacter sichuanensis]
MNKHIPCESDLKSVIPETWANAVTRCQGGAPHNCGADGLCEHGGTCFEIKELTLEQALFEIEHLKKELDVTRVRNKQIEVGHLNLIARLEHTKELALKYGKSERVFMIRQCLTIIKGSVDG